MTKQADNANAPPSPNGQNGRDGRGRFTSGNAGGPGNPHAARVSKLRSAMLRAVTAGDVRKAIKALVQEAEKGNVSAIRELLDRAIGRPTEPDIYERMAELERIIRGKRKR